MFSGALLLANWRRLLRRILLFGMIGADRFESSLGRGLESVTDVAYEARADYDKRTSRAEVDLAADDNGERSGQRDNGERSGQRDNGEHENGRKVAQPSH